MLTMRGRLSDTDVNSNPRCRSCDGVCCRSFPTVMISTNEYFRLQSLGAQRLYLSLRGRHVFVIENGCEFLISNRCSIYDDRPEICRRFMCEPADADTV